MPKLSPVEYQELKEFFGYFSEQFFPQRQPHLSPMAFLSSLEKTSPTKAAAGLWMAIRDCLEMTDHWDPKRVQEIDVQLKERGVLTLSELRARATRRREGILTARSKATRARTARAPHRGR